MQLGHFYANGFGVSKGNEQANKWFEHSTEKDDDDADAYADLATYYQLGTNGDQDDYESYFWAHKAVDAGLSRGHLIIATNLLKQEDHQAPKKTIEHLTIDAKQENIDAAFLLEVIYTIDQYGLKALSLAKKWFNKTADKSHAKAKSDIKYLH